MMQSFDKLRDRGMIQPFGKLRGQIRFSPSASSGTEDKKVGS